MRGLQLSYIQNPCMLKPEVYTQCERTVVFQLLMPADWLLKTPGLFLLTDKEWGQFSQPIFLIKNPMLIPQD